MRTTTKLAVLCFAVGGYFMLSSGYIYAKATLAQYLIANAWERTKHTGKPQPPWAWADTYPVARMRIADENLYILSGSSPTSLAFGPGHMDGTALPGQPGNAVISGHRDTHFDVLENIKLDDVLYTQTLTGKAAYRVTDIRIVHEKETNILHSGFASRLTLVTCYPFNSLAATPEWRYVIVSELIG